MVTTQAGSAQEYDVGGVRLPRPFRIRRLGHFGINVTEPEVTRAFYTRLLGFRISDQIDFTGRLPEEELAKHGPRIGYFARHGTEHHSFVFFPRRVLAALYGFPTDFPEVTTNQITWQVASLREVVDGHAWCQQRGVRIHRAGRDTPGSNWHFYPFDPDGHVNELFYGIEQVGWDGFSKPTAMHKIRYREPPQLPHRSEYAEVASGFAEGVDPRRGWRHEEAGEERFDVGGILLARPFKVMRIGPVRLFVRDVEAALAFQREVLGATVVYADPDFAVVRGHDSEWMLHADHTYEGHPLHHEVSAVTARGAGIELRLHGCDPDAAIAAALARGDIVVADPADKPHGLREAYIADPDGYVWVPDVALAPG